MTALDDAEVAAPARARFAWSTLRGRWALGLVLICAALTGPIGYAGQLGYAALVGLAGIASLPMLGVRRPPMPEMFILLALVVWCCAAMGWSVYSPGHDFHRYKQIEGLTAIKLVLELALYGAFLFLMREIPDRWAGRILATLAVSLIAAAVVMTIDAFTGQSLYRGFRLSAHAVGKAEMIQSKAARGSYTLALLFWPVALWMRRSRWNIALAVFVLGFFAAAVGLNVAAPIMAVLLGGMAFFAVRQFGRPAIWVLLCVTVIYFALAPTLIDLFGRYIPAMHNTEGVAKESWSARVAIWRFVAQKVAERPWLGWGMDSSRVFDPIPLHPHSAAMQVWLELGMVGAALAALFWAWLWARIGAVTERSRADGGVAAAVAVAYLTIGGLSFGVWQEWWLAMGTLGVVFCIVFAKAFRDWTGADEMAELIPLG